MAYVPSTMRGMRAFATKAASRNIISGAGTAASTNKHTPLFHPGVKVQQESPLRVGGVPEHFNGPFHWALAPGGAYEAAGFKANWTMFPKGTGEMVAAVQSGEVDVACVLLEGGVAAIANGAPLRIFGTYVATPLTWGVHVKADAPLDTVEHLRGKTFGVSRMGSGSHLMACVMAYQRGWSMDDVNLKVCGSLDDAREHMRTGSIDAWLWEKFTTNYLVEQGEFKRVGEVPTPWPCFVLIAHEKTCATRGNELKQLLDLTKPVCRAYKGNVLGETVSYVSENHRLSQELAEEWLSSCDWACDAHVPPKALSDAISFLKLTGQISNEPSELVAPLSE
jgi:ABC-type nitrate/sulfonate/bicarbonate transport system substrate-binding protein